MCQCVSCVLVLWSMAPMLSMGDVTPRSSAGTPKGDCHVGWRAVTIQPRRCPGMGLLCKLTVLTMVADHAWTRSTSGSFAQCWVLKNIKQT